MEGLTEPLPASLRTALRLAVLELVTSERRLRFPPILHAGVPGGAQQVFPVLAGEALDQALRADVVAALLRRTGQDQPLLWLTRPGDLAPQDLDLAWLSAARAACGETGRILTMVVVTRHGWRDPRSGLQRTWVRLRPR